MVGRELTNRYPPKTNKIGDELLKVENLSCVYAKLSDVSFTARKGEVLGIAGLDGSGRTELLSSMFGMHTLRSGKLTLEGKLIRNKSPREAIKNGFAYLTEERRATGIFGILNIRENTCISSLKKYRSGPFLSKAKMQKSTDWCIGAMHVKTPTQETKIRSLSGGNQQKVILGRWLLTDPTVLLLDEPTRGIDVGAKYEIYKLINDLVESGRSVLMISSEMEELIGMSDRIIVLAEGEMTGELQKEQFNSDTIMAYASGITDKKEAV
jgi:methyl-galactoside transport system ATP-binding protein